ncbi:MAG: haloalkane dehalogenase [Deltaproteobacteria bacterium]|nr:haloalkane dehalogenase [Deltaproteobacteria bacterium]MBW2394427.1 haloalkane dehalogenase [Deltaproteobacteria bacterium]
MKALRTPDDRFQNLPGYPFAPHYTEVPDGDGGTVRIHHVDEGPRDGQIVICMHGQPTWSYLYRHMIPVFAEAGLRAIAPDLVGFGRSDKPATREDITYQRQVDWLCAWLDQNDFSEATLVGQDWGGLIGLRVVAARPDRFARVVVANTGLPVPADIADERVAWVKGFRANDPTPTMPEVMAELSKQGGDTPERSFAYWQKMCWETENLPIGMMIAGSVDGRTLTPEEVAAYDAPFPDPSFKMGPRAMPSQVPTLPDDPSRDAQQAAWKVFETWEKPLLCAFSDNDPVTGGGAAAFMKGVPGAQGQPHVTIEGGGHFLQEGRGVELATVIANWVKST